MMGCKPVLTPAQARYCRLIRRALERIPTTRDMAQRFGVSETTIRQAMRNEVKNYRRKVWAR